MPAPFNILPGDRGILVQPGGGRPVVNTSTPLAPLGLDEYISRCGRVEQVASEIIDIGPATTRAVDVGGVSYAIVEQRRRRVNDVVQHVFLQDMGALGVWPGELIQGGRLGHSDIAPIPLARASGTITLLDVIGGNGPRSADIHEPSLAVVNQARLDLLAGINPTDSAGQMDSDWQEAYTYREMALKFGLSVKGTTWGVDPNVTLNYDYKTPTVVAIIRQIYYTVAFAPSAPGAAGLFDAAVSSAALRAYSDAGNPPLYVSTVQYGRLIVVTLKSAQSTWTVKTAVKAQIDDEIKGTADFDHKHQETLRNTEAKIYTVGVPGRGGFQNINNPVDDLPKVYRDGLAFSMANPGAVVGFTARHIADASLAHVGLVAEYVQPIRAVGPDVDTTLPVWDGPGGGPFDTGIIVAPGDEVSINASGQIYAGVWLTGTNGPNGWPGWIAAAGSPVEGGTANALVIRFGNGPWIEAGSIWHGQNESGATGVLILGINDNDPYNGDPNQRWSVRIRVKRRTAAAAGIHF